MCKQHPECLLKDWSLWRRERDLLKRASQLWEVDLPASLEKLTTVMERVAGWDYSTRGVCCSPIRRLIPSPSSVSPAGPARTGSGESAEEAPSSQDMRQSW